MKSFMKLPRLKACSIRFEEEPVPSAQALISTVVRKLTSQANETDTPFRFNDLPADIKLVVLEHTGLVAPGSITLSSGTYVLESCFLSKSHDDWRRHPSTCSAVHNAYDSAEPCRTFPRELFQVNKELRKLSQSLFYSRNNIVLYGLDTYLDYPFAERDWAKLPRDRLQPLRYLTIRFCELYNFEPFMKIERTTDEEINFWVDKINFISQHIQLDMLTLVLELDHNPRAFGG